MANLTGRLLLQRCDKAVLKNQSNSEIGDIVNNVSIGKGLIVYVSYLKGATIKTVESMAKTICTVCLFNKENTTEHIDLANLPGDLLIVPHFCLGGKLRGKIFQYHSVADRSSAENLFLELLSACKSKLLSSNVWESANCKIECGFYGLRQDINAEMNGPMSHVVDFTD